MFSFTVLAIDHLRPNLFFLSLSQRVIFLVALIASHETLQKNSLEVDISALQQFFCAC